MAVILNPKVIPCKVDYSGPIPELGCICGPIGYCRLTIDQIRLLIKNGRTVYELNPNDITDMVRLTTMNMEIRQFEKREEPSEEPVVETVPKPSDASPILTNYQHGPISADILPGYVEIPTESVVTETPEVAEPEEIPEEVEEAPEIEEEKEVVTEETPSTDETSTTVVEQINPDNHSNYNGKKNRKNRR